MKIYLTIIVVFFSIAMQSQDIDKIVFTDISKPQKIDWFTNAINTVRKPFCFENKLFEFKLKRVAGYDIEDVAYENYDFFNQIDLYQEIFTQVKASSIVYFSLRIKI